MVFTAINERVCALQIKITFFSDAVQPCRFIKSVFGVPEGEENSSQPQGWKRADSLVNYCEL